MASWETVGRILRELPETRYDDGGAGPHGPVWRVNGKVLVRLNPRLRVPDEDEIRRGRGDLAMIMTTYEEREVLVQEDPHTFLYTPHYDTTPAVLVWLEAVQDDQLRELLTDAWRARAPKRLVRAFDDRAQP